MVFTLVDNSASIAELQQILNQGILSGVVDGVQVRYNSPEQIRKTIENLKKSDTVNGFKTKRRLTTIRTSSVGRL